MNKGSSFALSAAVAVAILMRPAGGPVPQSSVASEAAKSSTAAAAAEQTEGPWIASCNYWAPVRDQSAQSAEAPADVTGVLGGQPVAIRLPKQESGDSQELACNAESTARWGFPDSGPVHVTAIIATVPDPVHTHLSLIFDRAADAMLQAAADNGYVSSHYWLPWKTPSAGLRASAEGSGDAEPGHDPERERQPGLIILKRVPSDDARAAVPAAFYDAIYLFIVAESPTLGVNGFQLQSAFRYESDLRDMLGARFSTGEGRVAIVGPSYSGSAAPLRAGIQKAASLYPEMKQFEAMGGTSTNLAVHQLNSAGTPKIDYYSFDYNSEFDVHGFADRLRASGYDLTRFTLLVEDKTAFGGAVNETMDREIKDVQVIRFPREISLLRNAPAGGESSGETRNSTASYSPYLPFTVKDSNPHDSIAMFSRENSPLSQEAQLMTIARQLHRYRTQFIGITASDTLDQIFLAQFLHRSCPEATLVFWSPDLLLERDIDNLPFIGSITVTPYPLIRLGHDSVDRNGPLRTEPFAASYAYYNAVSYTLWHNGLARKDQGPDPKLQGYANPVNASQNPPLWITAIGTDGYYPLGVLNPRSSNTHEMLPALNANRPGLQDWRADEINISKSVTIYPSRSWEVLAAAIVLLCLLHIVVLSAADYWSPFTRDLAIRENDQPCRRSLYIHVSAAMLLLMACLLAFPALWLAHMAHTNGLSQIAAGALIVCGLWAVGATLAKTRYSLGKGAPPERSARRRGVGYLYARLCANGYLAMNLVVLIATMVILAAWAYACTAGSFAWRSPNLAGISFSYRSVNPASGVSPVSPALLLCFAWFLWGVLQTWRMRFSPNGRPRLPRMLKDEGLEHLFVSDDDLEHCDGPRDCSLFDNITCLLITRKLVSRLLHFRRAGAHGEGSPSYVSNSLPVDALLFSTYGALFLWLCVFTPIRAMDRLMLGLGERVASPYEFAIAALLFPLLAVSLAGWLRMIVIWSSLKRGLLDRLENLPMRFAFNRIKGADWMTLLRQSGLRDHWGDMARSLESMRQMLHQSDIQASPERSRLQAAHEALLQEVAQIRLRIAAPQRHPKFKELDSEAMSRIEMQLAGFAELLLSGILIPYWKNERTGLVESKPKATAARGAAPPARILVAEEFLAIQYMSLIRAVLANLRYLMIFVSVSFAVAIIAWNSYPFQPHQKLDWLFTMLMFVLGAGVVGVFAQLHRNPVLSRITDSKENELGLDFYVRVVAFGALPVITWLSYQFPEIGSMLYRVIQPVEPVLK